jgi:hypothetical protein
VLERRIGVFQGLSGVFMPCQMFFLTMVQGSSAVGLGGKVMIFSGLLV